LKQNLSVIDYCYITSRVYSFCRWAQHTIPSAVEFGLASIIASISLDVSVSKTKRFGVTARYVVASPATSFGRR
jgi:hypothetical protein